MKSKFRNRGFTLIELLLVITILGILAAVAIPKLFPQTEKARMAEAINILSAIRQNEEAYFLANGSYNSCGSGTGASINACYESLGMQNPNPGRYFNYSVTAGRTGVTDIFDAIATRNTMQDPDSTYRTKTMTIDETGAWGDGINPHPLRPRNPDGT